MIKIGDTVRKRLTGMLSPKDAPPPKMPGTVIWIHPQRRFYIAEFRIGNVKIRECFTEGNYNG